MMIALSIFMFPIKFEKHARNEWHTLITRLNAIENRNALIHLSLLSIFFYEKMYRLNAEWFYVHLNETVQMDHYVLFERTSNLFPFHWTINSKTMHLCHIPIR